MTRERISRYHGRVSGSPLRPMLTTIFFFGPFRVLSPNETSAKKTRNCILQLWDFLGFFPHFCQFGDSSALLYANSYVDYGIDLQRGHAMEYHPLG